MTLILIVDDKAIFREPIAAALRASGYETVCASNGVEALDVVRRRKPGLVLLDVAMPEVDGLEMLRRWREDPSLARCPVILLTAVAERDYVVRARELGAHDYLLKSRFSLEEMMRRVERSLREWARRESAAVEAGGAPGPGGGAVQRSEPSGSAAVRAACAPVLDRKGAMEGVDAAADLRAMSPIAGEVARMANGGRASVDDVAEVIRRDPVIALRVLRLANSSAYSRGDRVDTVKNAVIRIGLGGIGQAMLSLGVVHELRDLRCEGVVEPMDFWAHSIATGLISASLARRLGDGMEPDAAFTCGLLHDVGRLLLIRAFPEQFALAAEEARASGAELWEAETRVLRISHAEATERILTRWKFPRDLVDPIALHHQDVERMRRGAGRRFREAATLALADRLAHCAMIGDSGLGTLRPIDELARALRLESADLREAVGDAARQTDEMKFALLSMSNQEHGPDRREAVAAALEGATPVFVGSDDAPDAVGLFVSRLGAGEGKRVTVATLRHARERAGLEQRLRGAERPLVIVAHAGCVEAAEELAGGVGGRVVALPATPLALAGAIREAARGASSRRDAA